MAYADQSHLASFGLPTGWLDAVSSVDQDRALEAASDLIDSYISARYTLPLSSWGDDLRRAACHIASWDLLTRRGFDPENPADKAIRLRYEDIIKWLKEIAAGTVTPTDIVDDTPEEEADDVGGGFVVTSPKRGWGRI